MNESSAYVNVSTDKHVHMLALLVSFLVLLGGFYFWLGELVVAASTAKATFGVDDPRRNENRASPTFGLVHANVVVLVVA
jgi:hypothetical protein